MNRVPPKSPDITVITITRGRPDLLRRAISAVRRQLPNAVLEHLVLVDACDETGAMLESLPAEPHLQWRVVPRRPGEHSGPGRSSRLRNLGVQEALGDWIAFIDDDNDWESDHLSTLQAHASSGSSPAVHCAMQMFHRDGRAYCEDRVPWARDAGQARAEFARLVKLGVAQWGSNLFMDRADPVGTVGGVQSVDTGEWLIRRAFLRTIPFRTSFTASDEEGLVGEDDKLMADVLAAGVRPTSTNKPTLRYFVGGYSNSFEIRFDDSFSWRNVGNDEE
jgi:glycosyltransferase involved in cell wall biosynthesis